VSVEPTRRFIEGTLGAQGWTYVDDSGVELGHEVESGSAWKGHKTVLIVGRRTFRFRNDKDGLVDEDDGSTLFENNSRLELPDGRRLRRQKTGTIWRRRFENRMNLLLVDHDEVAITPWLRQHHGARSSRGPFIMRADLAHPLRPVGDMVPLVGHETRRFFRSLFAH
jgi:hypothetical protein